MMYINSEPYKWPYNGDLRADNTALMIIDMQTDFCGEGGYVDAMGYDISLTRRAIEPIKRLLAAARKVEGLTIIHTREGHRRICRIFRKISAGEAHRSARKLAQRDRREGFLSVEKKAGISFRSFIRRRARSLLTSRAREAFVRQIWS